MSEPVITDVFLTHDWGKDELGRSNHDRVALVNAALKTLGYSTWFDSDRMTGDIAAQMAAGIKNTRIVLVFVTQRYADKVEGENENDSCKLEFQYALRLKSKALLIPIVMEERMRRSAAWTGPVGLGLGGELAVRMYFDFSDVAKFTAAITELKQEIDVRLVKLQASVPKKSAGSRVAGPATTRTTSAAPTSVEVDWAGADSARIARNTKISSNTTVLDMKEWEDLLTSCSMLEDITSRVKDKRIKNMFVVVELLVYVTHRNSPSTEEADVFVNRLENIWQDNLLNKLSPQYIDSIISSLKLSPRQEKVQFIALLEKLKNSDTLCSYHDNVILSVTTDKIITCEQPTGTVLSVTTDKVMTVKLSTGTVYKVPFEFKHPGTPECHASGKCGFIIKLSKQGGYWRYELCKQDRDYNDTGLHLHEIVSSEEMYYYDIQAGTTVEGNTVRMPGRRGRWFPSVRDWKVVQCCVCYNVSGHLAAKQD